LYIGKCNSSYFVARRPGLYSLPIASTPTNGYKLKTLVVLPLKEDQILLKDRLEKAIEYKELLRFEYSLNKPAGLPEEIKRLEAPDRSRLGISLGRIVNF
jgi:hypothetical protein